MKALVLAHAFWIIIAAIGLLAAHSWLAEHDARLVAEQVGKAAEIQVKTLEAEMSDRAAASKQQIDELQSKAKAIKTTPQAAVAIPKLVNLPVAPVAQPDNSLSFPAPDVIPLAQALTDAEVCKVELATVSANLDTEKQIVGQKDTEIKAIKHPKGFWKRMGGTAKAVGIGIGIGLTLGRL